MTAVVEAGRAARGPRTDVRSLTGLRVVAALWVVLFHWHFTPPPEYDGVKRALSPVLHSGYLGVDAFYVISGFVLTLTYVDALGPRLRPGRVGRYLWARVCRVWPAYALVTVAFGCWLLSERARLGPGRDIAYQTVQPSLSAGSWARQLLLVQQWTEPYTDGTSFIGAAWSVSAEMLAYVVFPVLVLVLFRLRRLPAWLLGALAVGCAVPLSVHAFRTGSPYYPWSWAVRLAANFGAGALVCLAVRRTRVTPAVQRVASAVAVLALVQLAVVVVWADGLLVPTIGVPGRQPDDRFGVATALFPVLVGALALSTNGPARVLSTPAAVLGGRISYSLYLVHVPVLEVFWVKQMQWDRIAPGGPYTGLVVPNLVVASVLLAYLLWRGVEEPARTRLRRLVERRPRVEDLAPARERAPAA